MKLTAEHLAIARKLRLGDRSWGVISRVIGCTRDTLQRAFDPEWKENRNRDIRAARAKRSGRPGRGARSSEEVPAAVLADRERRRSLDLTPNQMVLGDPAPGRSALDRMRGAHA